jgi:outer membrane protein insertion porin family
VAALLLAAVPAVARAQATAPGPTTAPTTAPAAVSADLVGRRVDQVRVEGNARVSSQQILNQCRTHAGDKFDPDTVAGDYQRVFDLKRFSNVRARVEPQADGGVDVVFSVSEEKLIHQVKYIGNKAINDDDLAKEVDVKAGEAIVNFRIALAKRAIIAAYKAKNFPYAHVEVDTAELDRTGDLTFRITEGQPVTIRNIVFVGLHSFTYNKMKNQIQTTRWYWIFNPGTLDEQQLDADVGSIRQWYKDHGFFDVKVGRKVIVSPDQTEVQINFLIDEGIRYKVTKVTFVGNRAVGEAALRRDLHLTEGQTFDSEVLALDVKQIVKAYSPLGYIYDPRSPDPDYLRIGRPSDPYPAHLVYHSTPGTVELVYEIAEGKPFTIGRIYVVGNAKTQAKLALRELRGLQSGALYDSGAVADDEDRLRGTPYFQPPKGAATISPVPPAGGEPATRDLLVQVRENQTASVSAGAQVNSSLGLSGQFSYEQKNFDIFNPSPRPEDLLSGQAWTGAGQDLRIDFDPGTQVTSARVLFSEPYLLDQPYSLTTEGHFQSFEYAGSPWIEQRAGGSVTLGKQFTPAWSAAVTAEGEDVDIHGVEDYFPTSDKVDVLDPVTHEPQLRANGSPQLQLRSIRAADVLDYTGHTGITDLGFVVRRDTTNHGPLPYRGTNLQFNYELYGALGGGAHFDKFRVEADHYLTVNRDLLDRRTVLGFHAGAGYITPGAPFFERFYGGGIAGGGNAAIRGFEFRGVGPRAGRALDPIGGDFDMAGTVELNFPIYQDELRGVIFDDFGTVEPDIRIHTIRDSVGVGVRVVIPFLGNAPLAFDLAFPVVKGDQDIRQVFSFGARTP